MSNPTFKKFMSGHVSKQKVFDYVRERLLEQGKASVVRTIMNGSSGCAYRSPDGSKCAVGWLIPDRSYDPNMEGSVDELFTYYHMPIHEAGVAVVDKYEFLTSLQDAHDNLEKTSTKKEFRSELKKNLKNVAEQYNLKY